ncbi:uncharacterized protein [Coffea arabica]|uniref:Uncharacterized protein isoform X1 n=1 Tax=Coffea arabica TaxID=13443 RepID=A0A6P6WUU7_COFAR|nr:uncharacterized protein LOC113736410 isoform X1 [Coffea arabica]
MDVQDHKKTPSSAGGHEGHGVHLCHKCGWPFPNPHPSAKHRRAHKRVCGKVEGYKLVDSEIDHVSDDDHLSDDDIVKTPSPKMEKRSVKEVGSGAGIGLKSSKSEDDVFSDAVTEFSDSGISPSIEERLESVREVDNTVGAELVHELNDSQKSEDCRADDTTKQLDDLTTGREISNAEVVESVINQSENTKPASDNRAEEVSFGVEQTDGLQINSSPSVFETISEDLVANAESGKQKEIGSSKSETNIQVKESVNEVESSTESVVLLSKSPDEASLSKSKLDVAEGSSGCVVVESKEHEADRKVSDTVTMEPKLHEANGSISHAAAVKEIVEQEKEPSNKSEARMTSVSTVNEIIEQEKGLSNVLQAEMTKVDLPSQTEPHKCADTSVTTQAEADSDTIRVGHDELAKVCDLKEGGDKEVHVVSVAETLPAVENPEIMIGDFKDYKVLRSSFPVDLGDAEVTRSGEDDNKVNLPESVPSPSSSVPVGRLHTSNLNSSCSEASLEKEGLLTPVQGEVDTSGLRGISEEGSGSNGLEGSSVNSGFEKQVIEGCQPKPTDKESSQDGVPAPSSIEHSDVMRAVSSIDEEFSSQTTKLSNFETADDNVNLKSDHVRSENGTDHLLDEDNISSSKKCTIEVDVETSQGTETGRSTEVQRSEGVFVVDPDLIPEGHSVASGEQSENPKEMETQISSSDSQLKPEDHGGASDKKSEDYKEAAGLPVASTVSSQSSATVEDKITNDAVTSEIGKSTEVQRSEDVFVVDPDLSPDGHSVASGEQSENPEEMETQSSSSVSQLKPEDHGGAYDKKLEDYKEAAALPVASTISSQSSATVEDKITNDAVISQPLLDGDNGKLTKESVHVSAVDDSVVSSSRTESLDGNWGSVSVLSTQSDGAALADAETLSSAGNQGPEKSGVTSLKLQTPSQDSHPDKSDAFEPPSFMTLVESRVEDDKKVVATETHNIQKTEQPNSEALQAGWFPSLTNVVNESEGRKKNEEIIAKVTNWNAGKQHSPLKNLLNEAQAETKVKSADQKQVPSVNQGNETVSKNNGAAVTTVGSIMGSETPVDNAAKRDMEKEWNSPARYPVEIKKEKKKGKPYWVPFVCCTSIHQDV